MIRPEDNQYAQTPVALVRYVLLAYEKRGRDPAAALRTAHIRPEQLHDARQHVEASQFERLCSVAMQELDDEALGWFSRRLPWGSYGMLARASISAPVLGQALARWCRHHNLLTDDVQWEVQRGSTHAQIRIVERHDLGELREFALLSLLRNLHGFASWLVDSRITLHCTRFPFAAPAHADLYARLFPGPVHFGAPVAMLQFDHAYLQLPLRRDGAALDQMLQRALPILIWPYRRDRLLSLRVRRLLAEPRSNHTADTLAEVLCMSPRTLYRELRHEGTSLQKIKDSVRSERAQELLARTSLTIKQISGEAGFASEKSFIRAFARWTGQTPQAWREQRRTG
ncbi:MAG: AraC family transcriptional regulator [Ottowia sp.]|nr:AraC family transcriptional regulator [Ottowia sp.]